MEFKELQKVEERCCRRRRNSMDKEKAIKKMAELMFTASIDETVIWDIETIKELAPKTCCRMIRMATALYDNGIRPTAKYINADTNKEFIEGIKRGVRACKEGRVRPWVDVKSDLGLI